MALPPGWNWLTGDARELAQFIFNNQSRSNTPHHAFANSGQNHIKNNTTNHLKFVSLTKQSQPL